MAGNETIAEATAVTASSGNSLCITFIGRSCTDTRCRGVDHLLGHVAFLFVLCRRLCRRVLMLSPRSQWNLLCSLGERLFALVIVLSLLVLPHY
jgi:hypothetical protein